MDWVSGLALGWKYGSELGKYLHGGYVGVLGGVASSSVRGMGFGLAEVLSGGVEGLVGHFG